MRLLSLSAISLMLMLSAWLMTLQIIHNIRGAQHPLMMKHVGGIMSMVHSIIPPLPQTTSSIPNLEPDIPTQPFIATAPKWVPYKCKLCKAEGHTHKFLPYHLEIF